MMESDWLYSSDRMQLRERALSILLNRYGSAIDEGGTPLCSTESIYACAHDWVSQGNIRLDGIIKYYEAYYKNG